jgi:hypothetical protein
MRRARRKLTPLLT